MVFRVLFLLLSLAAVAALRGAEPATPKQVAAGLEFVAREIALVAEPGAQRLETEFVFVNRAAHVVQVAEVKATCGCTVPSLEKTSYAPGEEGRVRVIFSVGSRQGLQLLSIKVRTDAGEHDLLLRVEIPPRFTFLPRLLVFRGGEAGAKVARLTYHAGTPVTLPGSRNTSPAFAVTVREIEAGREFELTATYVGDAAQAHTASFEVRSRDAAGREFSDRLYLRHAP